MNVTEFVLARTGDREAVARAATPGPWYWEKPSGVEWATGEQSLLSGGKQYPVVGDVQVLYASGYDASGIEGEQADRDHIALNDPAYVLARCAVDRQIVALHRLYDDHPYRGTPCCERCTAGGEYPADDAYTDEQNWPCPTLRALASLDADHPDYDESWRP